MMIDPAELRLELRHPARYRCANCKRPFRGRVIDGLWCSEECVIIPDVSDNPADWPREHYSPPHFNLPLRPKRSFATEDEAKRAISLWARRNSKEWGKKRPYCCTYCFQWHVGLPGKKQKGK